MICDVHFQECLYIINSTTRGKLRILFYAKVFHLVNDLQSLRTYSRLRHLKFFTQKALRLYHPNNFGDRFLCFIRCYFILTQRPLLAENSSKMRGYVASEYVTFLDAQFNIFRHLSASHGRRMGEFWFVFICKATFGHSCSPVRLHLTVTLHDSALKQ